MSWSIKRGWRCVRCGKALRPGVPAWVRESTRPATRVDRAGTVTRRYRERVLRFWCLPCGGKP